jgi:hypothetical protein
VLQWFIRRWGIFKPYLLTHHTCIPVTPAIMDKTNVKALTEN